MKKGHDWTGQPQTAVTGKIIAFIEGGREKLKENLVKCLTSQSVSPFQYWQDELRAHATSLEGLLYHSVIPLTI